MSLRILDDCFGFVREYAQVMRAILDGLFSISRRFPGDSANRSAIQFSTLSTGRYNIEVRPRVI